MGQVHVVYAHPRPRSFTHEVLDAFLSGLGDAGHTYTVSDLYAMGFRAEMTPSEYEREAAYRAEAPIADDVAAEQAHLDAADAWAFIYPVWWSDVPAVLKGWFDRVWTVGFAYKTDASYRAEKALVLCTCGFSVAELERQGIHQAMRTIMLDDRIGERARTGEFVVLGGSVLRNGGVDADAWTALKVEHLARAAELGRSLL